MVLKKRTRQQSGATMIEAMIAVPLVLVACLLALQMMLLYRAKISLNFATQEAARIGAMSNGRVVPRFLSNITEYATIIRRKSKCLNAAGGTETAATGGSCPAGSTPERADPGLPSRELTGNGRAADGNPPTGGQFSTTSDDSAATPSAVPTEEESRGGSESLSAAKPYVKKLALGMIRYGDSSTLQGFINGIAPLYTTGIGFTDVAKGQLDAYGDAMINSCIIYHSPTHAAFLDFGFVEADGPDNFVLQIPNDLLRYRVPADVDFAGKHIGYYKSKGRYLSDEEGGLRGLTSSMSVQEATLLSIEVKYSYPLKVPIAREILIGLARLTGGLSSNQTAMGIAFNDFSLDHGRWPMSGFATYRMQTPVHWHMFYPFGSSSNIRTTGIEAFDGIQVLWNLVAEKVNDSFDPAEPQIGFCPGLLIDSLGGNVGDRVKTDSWFGKDYDTRSR